MISDTETQLLIDNEIKPTDTIDDTENDQHFDSEDIPKSKQILSTATVFPLIINGAIGTGVFGLPFAYYEAGVWSSLIVLFVFFIINNITSKYVLEALSRLQVLPAHHKTPVHYDDTKELIIENTYGYTEMGNRLAGPWLKYFTIGSLVLNCFAGLWAYVATVVTTLTTVYWIIQGDQEHCVGENHFQEPLDCNIAYYLALFLYGIIVIPISFLDVGQQTIIQVTLTITRFVAFILMIITCIVQLAKSGPLDSERSIFNFYWSGFGTMFTHSAFAFVVQHNIPGFIQPVKGHRKYVESSIFSAFTVSTIFYALLGVICAYTFNGNVMTPVTLNWANYTGREGGWGEGTELWFGYIVKYFIMFVPVLNLTSTFPLLANTLAHNIQNLFPEEWNRKHPKKCKYGSRAIAIFPPFILSCFIDSLEIIFDFAGMIAFFLAFTLPCLYIFYSLYRFNKFKLFKVDPKTPYTNKYCSNSLTVIIIFVSTLIAFIAAVSILCKETIEGWIHGDDISSVSTE